MSESSDNQFDFYEFAGILIPGAIVLFAAAKYCPQIGSTFSVDKMTVGELGLFAVLSYPAGHIIQAIAWPIPAIIWFFHGGMPTEWIRTPQKRGWMKLVADPQRTRIFVKLKERYSNLSTLVELKDIDSSDWAKYVHEIYAIVSAAGHAKRIDSFNRTYAMLRGVATAALVIAGFISIEGGQKFWPWPGTLIGVSFILLIRMYYFGRLYARELFFRYLAS